MTESDYSIKPLPNLPTISGMDPAKGSQRRQKRQPSRQSQEETESIETQRIDPDEQDFDDAINDNETRHIDFCA